jgi:uncharacterized protein (TIGR02452 family)
MNGFYRNGGGETAREARRTRLAEIFKDSVEMMQAQDLQESIKASKANTRTYFNENIEFKRPIFGKQTQVTVTNHRTFEAAGLIHERYPDKRIGVLNFASATNPGGGVVWGSSAQEESLCRCSTLYPALNQKNLLVNYYNFHRSRQDSLYTDCCIYTPDVKVIKSDTDYPERLDSSKFFNVDVITCAAPNLRHADPISDAELERLHLKRGRRILDIAVENKIDCLVLGAFGCGAFRNDPQIVARVYAKLMEEFKGAFDLVEFAVFYWGNEITNYQAFKDALG